MAYPCAGEHPEQTFADFLITDLGTGETDALCKTCFAEWVMGTAEAFKALTGHAAVEAAVAAVAAGESPSRALLDAVAPETAATATEDGGAATTPPHPKSGGRRRQAAPTKPESNGSEGTEIPRPHDDG